MNSKMKNIYIGLWRNVSEAFYNMFSKHYTIRCSDKNINEKWLTELDFTDYEKYQDEVINFKTDLLIHLGALTDLEECELNPDFTYLNNYKSVEYAVKISNEINIPLIFISTAGIFDGKDIYTDFDIPKPLSHYGKSKYLAEQYIEKNSKNFIICGAGL